MLPRRSFRKVQVTTSPADRDTFDTGLPSSQVALAWSQPLGTVSDSEYPLPGVRSLKVLVFERVGLESSSSEKLVGLRPPPAVKSKSWASFGDASLTAISCARLRLRKVQVTVSPAFTRIADTGLPSSHVAPVWSHPLGTVSATE